MEIKLECGITLEPNDGIFGLNEDLELSEGYDNYVRLSDEYSNFDLTDKDKHTIGTLMIDRWQRFMGVAEGHHETKQKPIFFCHQPTVETLLRAALRQCAIELKEASKLLRQNYPGVAEMLRIAADRAETTAKGATPSTQNETSREAALQASEVWYPYRCDFNAMTDEEIEDEVLIEQNKLDEAESWLEAVASWKEAGKPRDDKKEGSDNDPL